MSTAKASVVGSKNEIFASSRPKGIGGTEAKGSICIRHVSTRELTIGSSFRNEAATAETKIAPTEFLLFAGYNNCLRSVYYASKEEQQIMEFKKQPTFVAKQDGTYMPSSETNAPLKWRCVKAAVRFALTNSQEEDDGWFEACRLTPTWNGIQFSGRVEGATDASPIISGFHPEVEALYTDQPFSKYKEDMSSFPSYVSGKLRDIHHHVFALKRQARTHPMVEFASRGSATKWEASADPHHHPFVDESFDCVLIRIWGRATTTDAASRSKLLTNVGAIQEIVFDENNLIAQSSNLGGMRTYRRTKRYSKKRARSRVTKRRRRK